MNRNLCCAAEGHVGLIAKDRRSSIRGDCHVPDLSEISWSTKRIAQGREPRSHPATDRAKSEHQYAEHTSNRSTPDARPEFPKAIGTIGGPATTARTLDDHLDWVGGLAAFRDEETVGTIAAAVDDAGDVLVHIVEEEEVVAQQLHLLDRFLDVHRLHREAFRANEVADVLLVVQLDLVDGRDSLGLRNSVANGRLSRGVATRPFVMDAAELTLQFVESLVDGHDLVGRSLFGTEDIAAGSDGDLRGCRVGADPVMESTQLELRIDDPIEHAVEPRGAPVNEFAQAVVDPDAITADLNLHRHAPS